MALPLALAAKLIPLDRLARKAPMRCRIAVVDEDPGVRHALERTLRSIGYRVITLASGEESLAGGRSTLIDCLVLEKPFDDQTLLEAIRLVLLPAFRRLPAAAIPQIFTPCIRGGASVWPRRWCCSSPPPCRPGVEIWKRLGPDLRLYFPLSLSRDREVDYTEASVGASVDYRLNVHFSTRLGIAYAWSVSDTSYREFRSAGDLTYRLFPGSALEVSDRNRFELRDIRGTASFRYRNRIRVERTFKQRNNHDLTPYAMVEPSYDSRYGSFNRIRSDLGAEYRVSPVVSVEGYLVYQHDSRADVEHVYALGLTLILNF